VIDKINGKIGVNVMMNKILFITLLAVGGLFSIMVGSIQAQTATPSPTPSNSNFDETVTLGGYEITSSMEFGVRGLDVNGNNDKYRSDFNYNPGFRIFDSSFLMENKEKGSGKGKRSDKLFDSLLLTSTGWNSDPTGAIRFNLDKTGAYRFDGNVRRTRYYNRLFNHINLGGREPGWKNADTQRNFGDFDLTIFPESEGFRMRFGGSFYNTKGIAGNTTRALGDEFPLTKLVDVGSNEFRAGVDGKLMGFKMGLTFATRRFDDSTDYTLTAPHPGVNLTNIDTLTGLDRTYPIKGETKYGMFTIQRSFDKRLDFSGRFIYSLTDRRFRQTEDYRGRGTLRNYDTVPTNVLSLLTIVFGDASRTQSRGDLGVTYAVTDKFRISNTFSLDQFNLTGNSNLNETAIRTVLATGVPRPNGFSGDIRGYRLYTFKRFVNTVEGDYQFSPRFGINIGYRYTHRKVNDSGINATFAFVNNNVSAGTTEESNSTNTLLVGTRFKPYRNWSIFADLERGQSDNAFTRLSNYNFTNVRLRSNLTYKQFGFNVSAITRNNDNPSQTSAFPNAGNPLIPAGTELNANVKNRVLSAYVDWSPDSRYSVSAGYTYQHLTSTADIIVPSSAPDPSFVRGFSQFLMRDNFAFIDVSAQPFKRVGVFASYRFDKDRGQGDRTSNQINYIISSYPYRLHMPEIRVAIKVLRNVDWNVGYQFYDYREQLQNAQFPALLLPPPNQNYNAHMPYTSLRIYFGGGDRGR
jgi:hypothetical protein